MLRVIQNSRSGGAKSYYSTADYYTEGQELVGIWRGKGAARLGLEGEIDKPEWDALCDNRNPSTGRVLTARQKETRRVGYDFNFHVPKSLSLLYGLTGDERILSALRDSVNATMQDIESEMQTRVRAGGKNEDRRTGNMVWGEFIHTTARPVNGVPDPHLHGIPDTLIGPMTRLLLLRWSDLSICASLVLRRYCREAGRSGDFTVFGADATLRFNFLDHELTRRGEGAGLTENLVNLFSTVLEVADRNNGGGGGREEEGYWRRAGRQLCRNAVELLALARGQMSVPDLYRVVISAPTSIAQVRSPEWQERSLCFQCLTEAERRPKSMRQQADLEIVADYWLVEFPTLSEKTRSVIVSGFTSMADILIRGVLRDLFCADTNITPEAVIDGKVIVIDLPVKEFGEVGQFAQVLWKYAFQRSIERRSIAENGRPVFLWADEMQNFVTSYDMQFQTTCRAARVATVYLTQNISNVYAALGGNEKGRAEAASLFANLNTKILHAQGDPVTNEWAASLIGRSRQFFASGNSSRSAEDNGALPGLDWFGQPTSTSAGFSEAYEHEVQPAAFTRLRTGGPANHWNVDAIVFQNGRAFRNGKTWLPVTLGQKH